MSLSAATQSCDQFGQATTHKLWRNLQHAPLILIETTQQATDGQQHGSEPQQWVTIIPVQSSGHELLDMPGYDWIPRHLRRLPGMLPSDISTNVDHNSGSHFSQTQGRSEKYRFLTYFILSVDNSCFHYIYWFPSSGSDAILRSKLDWYWCYELRVYCIKYRTISYGH